MTKTDATATESAAEFSPEFLKEQAIKSLEAGRRGDFEGGELTSSGLYEGRFDNLFACMGHAGLAPKDIGTSYPELLKLMADEQRHLLVPREQGPSWQDSARPPNLYEVCSQAEAALQLLEERIAFLKQRLED